MVEHISEALQQTMQHFWLIAPAEADQDRHLPMRSFPRDLTGCLNVSFRQRAAVLLSLHPGGVTTERSGASQSAGSPIVVIIE